VSGWVIAVIVIAALFVIGMILWAVYIRPKAAGQHETQKYPVTTVSPELATSLAAKVQEIAEKDQTIASLTTQLEESKAETGKNLELLTQRAQQEIEARVAAKTLELEAQFHERKRDDRALSNLRSRGALLAKVQEHLGPLIPGFPYPLKEVRHFGEIFDFLVFDGLESGGEITVVFLEVKTSATGRTRRVTNPRERALRDAIKKGRVRYELWQPPSQEEIEELVRGIIDADAREAIAPPIDTEPATG